MSWTINKGYQLNVKLKHNLLCTLSKEIISKVHVISLAKEMGNNLALAHEGSNKVRRHKLNLLRHQYEILTMEKNEFVQFNKHC